MFYIWIALAWDALCITASIIQIEKDKKNSFETFEEYYDNGCKKFIEQCKKDGYTDDEIEQDMKRVHPHISEAPDYWLKQCKENWLESEKRIKKSININISNIKYSLIATGAALVVDIINLIIK